MWSRAGVGVVAVATPTPGGFYCCVCRARPRPPRKILIFGFPKILILFPHQGSVRGNSALWGGGLLPFRGPALPSWGLSRGGGLPHWGLPGVTGAPEWLCRSSPGSARWVLHLRWGFGAVFSVGKPPGPRDRVTWSCPGRGFPSLRAPG